MHAILHFEAYGHNEFAFTQHVLGNSAFFANLQSVHTPTISECTGTDKLPVPKTRTYSDIFFYASVTPRQKRRSQGRIGSALTAKFYSIKQRPLDANSDEVTEFPGIEMSNDDDRYVWTLLSMSNVDSLMLVRGDHLN